MSGPLEKLMGPAMTTSPKEKRAAPRIVEEDGIAVRIVPLTEEEMDGGAGTLLRLTCDISRDGLSFTNHEALEPATPVRIHLALEIPRKIVTHVGEVRWARRLGEGEPFRVGVQFTDSAPLDRQVWSDYVSSRLQ